MSKKNSAATPANPNQTKVTKPANTAKGRRKPAKRRLPKVNPARPCYAVYYTDVELADGGKMLKAGLYWHGIRDNAQTDTHISTPIEVIASTKDVNDENYGQLLKIMTSDGIIKEWALPMEMLGGGGDEMRRALLSMGARIKPKQREDLLNYIMSATPTRKVIAATATGWLYSDVLAAYSFVMPHQTIGLGDIRFQSTEAGGKEYTAAGTFEGWRDNVAQLCTGNPVLVFSVCVALAGVLLERLDIDSGGFHLVGDSSSGKSISALVACSVWGKPKDFKRNWNATAAGLEGIATMRNDTALILDEIGEASPKDIGGIIYQLGNGVGRQRGTVSGMARPVNQWRMMVLSNGELTAGKYMEMSGQRIKAGQELRLLDIPVQRRYGAFDNLHNMDIPHDMDKPEQCRGAGRKFAEALRANTNEHYGHAGVKLIEHLINRNTDIDIHDLYAELRAKFPVTTGQESRAAARFTVCALAGLLAIEAGILPWSFDEVTQSANELYHAWITQRGRGQSEDRKILQAINDFIIRNAARFEDEGQLNSVPVVNRAGFFRDRKDKGRMYLFSPNALSEATTGYDIARVISCLSEAGVIAEADSGRRNKLYSIKGEKIRLYAINQNELSCALDA
ncbi:DUF927 domain-containing protein [Providencia stuartii]|uniref:DUF927 domain-containing protein n=1 Tax=Providencia stuartii TaxID=588 RepID=UPI000CE66872|nr:DUF927 domain-containing protein [Providencia stuartii]AVE42281.1 hypothetical protein AM353_10800 [Providencia stuartii]